jgi:uncharacterized hydrophobic protein (TIGR00271 family)
MSCKVQDAKAVERYLGCQYKTRLGSRQHGQVRMTGKRVTPQSLSESYRHLVERTEIDLDFVILTMSAAGICSFGFEMNSPAVIVGAMVISPLLYPVIAVGVSLFWRDLVTFKQSMMSFAVGLGLALLVSILVNAAIPSETRSEIVERLSTVPFYYFIVAFLSGVAGTFAFFWPGIVEALAGIAISVALVPPVVMLGIGISEISIALMRGSAEIVGLNVIGMVLGAYGASAGLTWYARD